MSDTLTHMPTAYLVSDIHLTAPESPRARLIVAFLHTLLAKTNITHLFVLGDIFDIISGHAHVRDDCHIDTGTGTFRSVNLGSWMDAPCYFKLDGTDESFYELTEENLRQPGVLAPGCLSAVK